VIDGQDGSATWTLTQSVAKGTVPGQFLFRASNRQPLKLWMLGWAVALPARGDSATVAPTDSQL
jgi:hypothetical protein